MDNKKRKIKHSLQQFIGFATMSVALTTGNVSAQVNTYGVPNPAACIADGKLWYNDAYNLKTVSVETHRIETIGRKDAMNYDTNGRNKNSSLLPWDMAWGADANLYGISERGLLFNIDPRTGATTQIASLRTGLREHNGLSGLPDGRLLVTGQKGYKWPDATTSKIYAVTLYSNGGASVREWFDVRKLTGFNVNGTGDSVVHRGAVYSMMHGARGANDFYLVRVPINMLTGEPNGQASFQKIQNAEYGYGMASLNGELYLVRANFHGFGTAYHTVHKLEYSLSGDRLQSAKAVPLNFDYVTNRVGRGIYGLTARPEPWGGFCPPTIVKTPPVADSDSRTTPMNQSVTFDITMNDRVTTEQATLNKGSIDLDPSTPARDTTKTVPGQGTFTIDNAGNVTFQPVRDYVGVVTIPYIIKDSNGLSSNQANITVTIQRPPVAENDDRTTPMNEPVTFDITTNDRATMPNVTLNKGSIDLDPSTPTIDTTKVVQGKGTFTIDNAGNVTFRPDRDYVGVVTIPYIIKDSNSLSSNQANITVTIRPLAPIDIVIEKTGPETAQVGQVIEYNISVYRTGGQSGPISGITVTDPVPDGLENVTWTCVPTQGRTTGGANPVNTSCADMTTTNVTGNGNLMLRNVTLSDANTFTGSKLQITVRGTVGKAGIITNRADVVLPDPHASKETVFTNNTAQVITRGIGQPLNCSVEMHAVFENSTLEKSILAPLSVSGVRGKTFEVFPVERNRLTREKKQRESAALAITPDGHYLFYVDYHKSDMYKKDVVSGELTKFSIPGWNASEPIIKMAIGRDGIGYMASQKQLWRFTTDGRNIRIDSPVRLTYTDDTAITPTPTINGNGDLIIDNKGKIFIFDFPVQERGKANPQHIDVFRVSPTGQASFYGRVETDHMPNTEFAAFAAIGDKVYAASSTSAVMLELDMTSLSKPRVITRSDTAPISDLASCYYPNLDPNVTSTKSVQIQSPDGAPKQGTVARVGDLLEYTIITRNDGNLNAANIKLTDAIPQGTTYVPGSTRLNGVTLPDVNGVMPYANGGLISSPKGLKGVLRVDKTPNDTTDHEAVVKFKVRIEPGVTQVVNRATVVHVDGGNPTNNVQITVDKGQPALSIVKAVNTTHILVDVDPNNITSTEQTAITAERLSARQLQYTITVTNTGNAKATGVKVSDVLPNNLEFVSATIARSQPNGGYTASAPINRTGNGQELNFAVGELDFKEPARSAQIVITANVKLKDNVNLSAISNTAAAAAVGINQVQSAPVKTDVTYNKLMKKIRYVGPVINQAASMDLFRTDETRGLPGDYLEYCLQYKVFGSLKVEGFAISDVLESNLVYNETKSNASTDTVRKTTYNPRTGELTFAFNDLAPGTQGQACFFAQIKN